ncbi:MAG: PQQ-binding-like beta-propeller repeat protein [Myxococcales bacterium]|jgi:outer membrane protein assembly factor BamB
MYEEHVHTTSTGQLDAFLDEEPGAICELRELLLSRCRTLRELPALPDLAAAALALARATRHRVILPLGGAPAEFALMRRGMHVQVDCYGTESAPEVFQRGHAVELCDLLDVCAEASRELGELRDGAAGAALLKLHERLEATRILPDPYQDARTVRCTGGSLESPGREVPLAFGFQADILPSRDPSPESHAFADVHALLFEGTLWAFSGESRRVIFEGPIMLAAQRMVAAVRALVDAWQADRNVHVRLRTGSFAVAIRREHGGQVRLSLGPTGERSMTWPALDLQETALPILRLASDLLRKLISVDRRQTHNLRVNALRSEVRSLRRAIRARNRLDSFENSDPDRLRLSAPELPAVQPEAVVTPRPGGVRYTERWSAEIDGLDACSVYLCGDRLVVGTQKLTLALERGTGQVLWSQPSRGAATMMAGRCLLRLSAEGELELIEVQDGNVYARTHITPQTTGAAQGLFAGGGDLPPMAVLVEARQRLVAVDLRTGQPRWRFRARGQGGLRMARSGRVLVVTSGHGTVDALDVATGEVVWRFGDRVRFGLEPTIAGDVVVAVAGEPGGGHGAVYGIDLYSGRPLWRRELPEAPSADPVSADDHAIVPHGRSRKARLLSLRIADGELEWSRPDPGLDNGGRTLCFDGSLIVNAPSGRVMALDLASGESRWTRALANPLTDDVPRHLDPALRQGGLFVPSAQVHILRPGDGTPLTEVGCDLVPDCLRVDERGWLYVAEESGHIRAYAAAPHLSLVRS